jgi:hypothetical protein
LETNLYQVIIGLALILVGSGSLFGYLVIRLIRNYDDQIKELFECTRDLPAVRKDIEWLTDEWKEWRKINK